ncbi:MAG: Unknown protein [uncultured Aureispira sp.]|uniref:Uncharacterized protein n=1 Tax=uncultured Aureispira sp. TaxID=1331704 RepID=A0A6S6UDE3_9BACT|nr:MAG: Unknown protein [uncultured Aureispira sp.]
MLEHNLLDSSGKIRLRKPFHTLLEIASIIGHGCIFLYCLYQLFPMGFIAIDAAKEYLLILISGFSVGYSYAWYRFSTLHDHRSKKTKPPVYLNTLRFLSFFMSGFLGFIAFLFVRFEDYGFELRLETAQAVTLFFAVLGVLQFFYTLLTPTKSLN